MDIHVVITAISTIILPVLAWVIKRMNDSVKAVETSCKEKISSQKERFDENINDLKERNAVLKETISNNRAEVAVRSGEVKKEIQDDIKTYIDMLSGEMSKRRQTDTNIYGDIGKIREYINEKMCALNDKREEDYKFLANKTSENSINIAKFQS